MSKKELMCDVIPKTKSDVWESRGKKNRKMSKITLEEFCKEVLGIKLTKFQLQMIKEMGKQAGEVTFAKWVKLNVLNVGNTQ